MKSYLTFLGSKEMYIKITIGYHSIRIKSIKIWQGYKLKLSSIAGKKIKGYSYFGKTFGQCL
jgi:hypothetical protein